jgi:hypothetical protein
MGRRIGGATEQCNLSHTVTLNLFQGRSFPIDQSLLDKWTLEPTACIAQTSSG